MKCSLPHCPDAVITDAASVLVGMYELSDGVRTGGLVSLQSDDLQTQTPLISGVGVLDIEQAHDATLVACSDGTIRAMKSGIFSEISVTSESGMKGVVMAVTGNFASRQAASITTAGELQLSDLDAASSLWRIQAHSKDWESWIVASDGSMVATGSDDRSFKLFDMNGSQIFASRFHESGVTWLDFDGQFSLITGSYDERMCFWDTRNLAAGPVQSWKLEGGVWRTKRLPGDDRFLVAMCYGGFGVYEAGVKLQGSDDLGLCYGVDLLSGGQEVVALDFYQKTVSTYPLFP